MSAKYTEIPAKAGIYATRLRLAPCVRRGFVYPSIFEKSATASVASPFVIPAKAGIQKQRLNMLLPRNWIPAFAGMTK